jgi:hypothetical protein
MNALLIVGVLVYAVMVVFAIGYLYVVKYDLPEKMLAKAWLQCTLAAFVLAAPLWLYCLRHPRIKTHYGIRITRSIFANGVMIGYCHNTDPVVIRNYKAEKVFGIFDIA